MRFCFLSDLHAHRFVPHAPLDAQGQNPRLKNAIMVIEALTNYVSSRQIECVIFGGDVFHTRGKIDTVTYNAVYEAMKKLEPWCDIILLVGNHDQDIEDPTQHVFEAFKPFCRVIDYPDILSYDYDIALFPFSHDSQEQIRLFKEFDRRSISLVSTHIGVAGIEGRTFFIPEQVGKEHLPKKPLTLLGHYHNGPQVNEHCYYAGSTQALDWDDANQEKYWLDVEINSGRDFSVRHIPAPGLRFIDRPLNELDESLVRGNIVRTRVEARDTELVHKRLMAWGALDAVVLPLSATAHYETASRQVTGGDLSMPSLVRRYAERCCPQGLSPRRLSKLGQEMLNG